MHANGPSRGGAPGLDSIVRALRQLSPQSRELVDLLISKLAKREGISVAAARAAAPPSAREGIEPWAAKLKGEGRSERTIKMYRYLKLLQMRY